MTRTCGQRAKEIADAVVVFLREEGYLDLGGLPEDIREKLEEVIFRAA